MSRRNSENAEKEQEHIQNTDRNESEGPGPPEPPGPSADQEQDESKIDQVIDQWTRGLRDDIEEVFEALLEADKRDADDRRKKTKEAVEDWTVSKICDGLKNGRFKNIVVFTGAGISTSAGIPDFRTPGTGLYDNLQTYNLDQPEDIFALDFFKINPKPFYTLAKEIMPGKFPPTIGHHFIAMLEEKGNLYFIKISF